MSGPDPVLWEYRPPRVHPILYALALVFLLVGGTGSLEIAARGAPATLYAYYWAPLAATVVVACALARRSVRIRAGGIEPGRAWLDPRANFVAWTDLAAVYPVSYDVTGAFVSPFASSDGKVTQTGLGLEWPDGRVETVRFTPSRFALNAQRSRGYREAIDLVRGLYAAAGRRLVPAAPALTDDERARLMLEARRPFLPFFAIVFLFASAAPVVFGLLWLHVPVPAALALGLVLPLGTSFTSWRRSRERNAILNRLHRAAEAARP